MSKFIKSKKGIVALLATLTVVALAAVGAYAYFTSTGNGSGSAKVGSASNWVVTTDAYTGGPLYPGHGSEAVAYHVNNPGGGFQQLHQVVIKVAQNDGSAWTSGTCSAADFTVGTAAAGADFTDTALAGDIDAGATVNGSVNVKMVDTGDAQDDCQGVTVPLYLSAS
jgi:hypothetical protein